VRIKSPWRVGRGESCRLKEKKRRREWEETQMMQFRADNRLLRQVVVPLLSGVGRLLMPRAMDARAPQRARWFSGRTFILSLWTWVLFDTSTSVYQMTTVLGWLPQVNIQLSRGVDGISRLFIVLNTLLTPLCVLASMGGIQRAQKVYYAMFMILEGFVNRVFLATDLLTFYVAFEAVLVPMFYVIGVWGSRARKVRAAYMFFLYTLFGSVFMLLALLRRYNDLGTRDMVTVMNRRATETAEGGRRVSLETQRRMWLAFFVSFAVKVPMMPLHIWLPEAHVEAPTAGSVILAGILLKLGTYGMVRVLVGLFPEATVYFTPMVYTRCVRAIVYTSRTAIRQTDMKRIIAYASVAHMNMTLVGLFSLTQTGVEGALLQMLSHGLVSGALFMCVGVLYDRHHTRRVTYYGGVAQTMPMFAALFMFFTMANIALPGTSSFVGEFMILVGIFQTNTFVAVMSATGMILGGAYSLWLYNRVAFGNLKTTYVGVSTDVNRRERRMLTPLVFFTLRMGLWPELFREPMHTSTSSRLEHVRTASGV
jgi:NADH-quinone oxidoreductase subunit M